MQKSQLLSSHQLTVRAKAPTLAVKIARLPRENMDKKRKVIQINLLCKNECGFYGNPEWDDYCSFCFKSLNTTTTTTTRSSSSNATTNSNTTNTTTKGSSSNNQGNRRTTSGSSSGESSNGKVSPSQFNYSSPTPPPSPYANFEKFEEKKRQQVEKTMKTKTLKSIFKRSSTFREKASSHSITAGSLPLSASSALTTLKDQKLFSFDTLSIAGEEVVSKFLREAETQDVKRQVGKVVDKLNKINQNLSSIEDMSEIAHEFYQFMLDRFESHTLYQGNSSEQIEQLIDTTEKLLLTQLYHPIFTRILAEDEDKDLNMQKRIKSLNWIMPDHLDVQLNMKNPQTNDLLDKAITEIIEMGSKQIPVEKLDCIVNCSKTIFKLLQVSNKEPVSADQFLPALVFVIIKANPPLLHSNIKFITRFSNPRRLMSGEGGYFFTTLCCAVAFIEKLNGDSLNLSEEEFQKYMSGTAVPPGWLEQSTYLRIVYSNIALIAELSEKQSKIETDVVKLKEKMSENREAMLKKLEPAFKPVNVPHYDVDSDIDINHVPSFMRSRILKQRSEMNTEGVLVEIENHCQPAMSESEVRPKTSGSQPCGLDESPSQPALPEPLVPEIVQQLPI